MIASKPALNASEHTSNKFFVGASLKQKQSFWIVLPMKYFSFLFFLIILQNVNAELSAD